MTKFFDHYRGLTTAVVLAALLALALTVPGCRPTTTSPFSGDRVTRDQLQAETRDQVRQIEIEQQALAARAAAVADRSSAALAEIEAQEALIDEALGAIRGTIAAVPEPWGGLAMTVFGLAAMGLGYDTRRKDRVIEQQSAGSRQQAAGGSL